MIEKTIIIKMKAEDEQVIKDMFRILSDQLNENYQLLGYKIKYKEDELFFKRKSLGKQYSTDGKWTITELLF